MISVLAKTSNSNRGVLFLNPYILDKNTLLFEENSIGVKSFYTIGKNYISITINKKNYNLAIDDEDSKILIQYHAEELKKATTYYAHFLKNEVDLLIDESNNLCTKELIETAFNPYYTKISLFGLNKLLKKDFKDIIEAQTYILEKIDLSKFELKDLNELGKFYIIQINDIK